TIARSGTSGSSSTRRPPRAVPIRCRAKASAERQRIRRRRHQDTKPRSRKTMAISEDPEGHEITALAGAVSFAGRRVVEIGCGDGRLTARYAADAAHVIAIDSDAEAVAALTAEQMPNVVARVLGIEQLDEAPRSADIVLFAWSL